MANSAPPTTQQALWDAMYGRNGGNLRLDWVINNLVTGGAYGDAVVADATNKYNRWLYENFESPSAQKSQLETAGYNPNYFGSSQVNPSPSASPSMSGKMNPLNNILQAAQVVNAFLGVMSEGVSLVSDIAAVPLDIAAKKWKNILLSQQGNFWTAKGSRETVRAMFDDLLYGGSRGNGSYTINGVTYDPYQSPAMQQMLLRNDVLALTKDLRSFDLNHLKPEEERLLQSRIRSIGAQAGISEKALDYFDTNTIARLLAMFLGFIK